MNLDNKYVLRVFLIFCKSFYIFFLSACLYSCEKEPLNENPKDIIGKWRWIETWIGIPNSNTNPANPLNTGIEEQLVFKSDKTWFKTQNNVLVDSGMYSIGHGIFTNSSSTVFFYDSICYFRNGIKVENGIDYYEINNDTLVFGSGFANKWWSYTLPHAGTKRWIKEI